MRLTGGNSVTVSKEENSKKGSFGNIKRWLLPSWDTPKQQQLNRVPAGLYAYQTEREGEYVRFHLRVENSGHSLLLAAASEAVLLSPSGTIAAKALLDEKTPQQASELIPYVNSIQVVSTVKKALNELGRPGIRFPIFNLADPAAAGHEIGLIAPFQADVVLGDQATTDKVLENLWNAGIPHVRFVQVEQRSTEEVVNAVERAEDMGMIAGIRGTAGGLVSHDMISAAARVGLDYVVIPWAINGELHNKIFGDDDFQRVEDAISRTLSWEMTPVVDIALTRDTLDVLEDGLNQLETMSVANVEVFPLASDKSDSLQTFEPQELRQLATWIEDVADDRRMQIIWLPPIEASLDPVELARRGPRAAGDVSIRVEADGSVIPPRGRNRSVGNIVTDSWETIWKHERFTRYRSLIQRDTHCDECPGLSICAADCPADTEGWVKDA